MNPVSNFERIIRHHNKSQTKLFRAQDAEETFLHSIGVNLEDKLTPKSYVDKDKATEMKYFQAMHYLSYWLKREYKSKLITQKNINIATLYENIRAQIINANYGLTIYMVGTCRIVKDLEFEKAVTWAEDGLFNAAEGFDPWRGFAFSTFACRSIITSFCRMIKREQSDYKKVLKEDDRFLYAEHLKRKPRGQSDISELRMEKLMEVMSRNNILTPKEKDIILHRMGFKNSDRNCNTLEIVGKKYNISKERTRQIESGARMKLRKVVDEELAELVH